MPDAGSGDAKARPIPGHGQQGEKPGEHAQPSRAVVAVDDDDGDQTGTHAGQPIHHRQRSLQGNAVGAAVTIGKNGAKKAKQPLLLNGRIARYGRQIQTSDPIRAFSCCDGSADSALFSPSGVRSPSSDIGKLFFQHDVQDGAVGFDHPLSGQSADIFHGIFRRAPDDTVGKADVDPLQ